MDLVDGVYIINLDRSPDRLAYMAEQCARHGLEPTRVPAVDGAKVKPKVLQKVATPLCRKMCTPSTIGCALSHMRTWKAVVAQGQDRVIVLEDDAQLAPDFVPGLREALRYAPDNFDVLLLGCYFLCDKERKYSWGHYVSRSVLPISLRKDDRVWGDDKRSIFVPEFFAGTHAYVVSQKGCRRLLELLPQVAFHVDTSMNHPDLKVYAVSPDLAFQRDMAASTIASFSFPKTLTPMLQDIKDSKNIPVAYFLDAPIAECAGLRINVWTLVFVVLGAMHAVTLPYVAGFMAAELVVGGDVVMPAVAYCTGWVLHEHIYRQVT